MSGFRANFTILDNEDAKDLIDLVVKEAKIDRKERRFPKGQDAERDLQLLPSTPWRSLEDTCGEQGSFLFDILDRDRPAVQRATPRRRRAANAMDFDDLLYFWHRLLAEDEELRKALRHDLLPHSGR